MSKEFNFADFKMTSQEWNSQRAGQAVVNPSSDNGRSFWSGGEEQATDEQE